MGKRTVKFGNFIVNKKWFPASKKPIALNLVKIEKIIVSDRFKHSDKCFKYSIGYTSDNIIGPLCIASP